MDILDRWVDQRTKVILYHTNGYKSDGIIVGYDTTFLQMQDRYGDDKLIRWSAVSTIQPDEEWHRAGPDKQN